MTAPEQMLKPCPNPWCKSAVGPMPFALRPGGVAVICGCDFHGPTKSSRAEAITAWNTRPATDELVEALRVLKDDPNAVHVNMLRGSIARPSIPQIIHIYGEEAMNEALTRPAPAELVEALERARPHVACTADCGTNAPGKMFPGECSCGAKDARDLIDTALRNAGAAP